MQNSAQPEERQNHTTQQANSGFHSIKQLEIFLPPLDVYETIGHFLTPKWALSQWHIRLEAKWAIDSKAMMATGIIVLIVKSKLLIKKKKC